MMRFRRQRHDQIEGRVVHIAERGRAMPRQVDADFFHDGDGERTGVPSAHASPTPHRCACRRWRRMAAAIGERTALRLQAKRTAPGRSAFPPARHHPFQWSAQ